MQCLAEVQPVGPLRERGPALVLYLVVVAVAIWAGWWYRWVEDDGHDIVGGLLEVVRAEHTLERTTLVQELKLLAPLPPVDIVVGVKNEQRRVVRVAIACPADAAVGADRFERQGLVDVEREVQRAAPILELTRQWCRTVVVIRPQVLLVVGAAIIAGRRLRHRLRG